MGNNQSRGGAAGEMKEKRRGWHGAWCWHWRSIKRLSISSSSPPSPLLLYLLSHSYRLQSVILINGVDELLVGHEAAVAVEVVLRQLVSVPRRHRREGQLAQIPQNGLVEAIGIEAVQARDDLFAPALIIQMDCTFNRV